MDKVDVAIGFLRARGVSSCVVAFTMWFLVGCSPGEAPTSEVGVAQEVDEASR